MNVVHSEHKERDAAQLTLNRTFANNDNSSAQIRLFILMWGILSVEMSWHHVRRHL